jgi:hypothetical protein
MKGRQEGRMATCRFENEGDVSLLHPFCGVPPLPPVHHNFGHEAFPTGMEAAAVVRAFVPFILVVPFSTFHSFFYLPSFLPSSFLHSFPLTVPSFPSHSSFLAVPTSPSLPSFLPHSPFLPSFLPFPLTPSSLPSLFSHSHFVFSFFLSLFSFLPYSSFLPSFLTSTSRFSSFFPLISSFLPYSSLLP